MMLVLFTVVVTTFLRQNCRFYKVVCLQHPQTRPVYTGRLPMYTAVLTACVYMPMYMDRGRVWAMCTAVYGRVHGHVRAVYMWCAQPCTRPRKDRVHDCVDRPFTRPCPRPCTGRMHAYTTVYTAVYTCARVGDSVHGRGHGPYTVTYACTYAAVPFPRPCTGSVRHVYGRVPAAYTAAFTACVYARVHGPWPCTGRVHGRVWRCTWYVIMSRHHLLNNC